MNIKISTYFSNESQKESQISENLKQKFFIDINTNEINKPSVILYIFISKYRYCIVNVTTVICKQFNALICWSPSYTMALQMTRSLLHLHCVLVVLAEPSQRLDVSWCPFTLDLTPPVICLNLPRVLSRISGKHCEKMSAYEIYERCLRTQEVWQSPREENWLSLPPSPW